MENKPEVSVVVPVYNNGFTLRELVARLSETLEKAGMGFELIFIDDGSQDESLAVLKKCALENPQVKVMSFSRNFGQHMAISAGFESCAGKYIVLMDADLQDPPEEIPLMIESMKSNHTDITYTIRSGQNNNRVTSKLFHATFSRIIGEKVPEAIGTFRVFSRKVLVELLRYREVDVLFGPLMFYMGYKKSYIEIPYVEREGGNSSYTFSKRLKLAVGSLISYTDIPHKINIFVGLFFFVASLIYSLLILFNYFVFGSQLPDGMTLLVLMITIAFGSIMFFLGVIGTYLFRVYRQVLDRPRYHIDEKINF